MQNGRGLYWLNKISFVFLICPFRAIMHLPKLSYRETRPESLADHVVSSDETNFTAH